MFLLSAETKCNRCCLTRMKKGELTGRFWASERAQWVRGLAAKPDELSLISQTHRVEGLPQAVLLPPHIHEYEQIYKNK